MTTYADRVRETSATTGTGDIVLDGFAPEGYQTWAESPILAASTVAYCMTLADQWEVGYGTFNGTTGITRLAGSVLDGSSGPGVLVNFAAGTKDVFCTAPAAVIDPEVIEASIVPRAGLASIIEATEGTLNEIAVATDTNQLYRLKGPGGGAASQLGGGVANQGDSQLQVGFGTWSSGSGAIYNNFFAVGNITIAAGSAGNAAFCSSNVTLDGDSNILIASDTNPADITGDRNIIVTNQSVSHLGDNCTLIGGPGFPVGGIQNSVQAVANYGLVRETYNYGITTTNATPTTLQLYLSPPGTYTGGSPPIGANEFHKITIRATQGTNTKIFERTFATGSSGTLIAVKPAVPDDISSAALSACAVAITVSAGVLSVTVTGIAATTITWRAFDEVAYFV